MSWAGKILRVNLTAGTVRSEPLNMGWAKQYLGSRGLAAGGRHGAGQRTGGPDDLVVDRQWIDFGVDFFDQVFGGQTA